MHETFSPLVSKLIYSPVAAGAEDRHLSFVGLGFFFFFFGVCNEKSMTVNWESCEEVSSGQSSSQRDESLSLDVPVT